MHWTAPIVQRTDDDLASAAARLDRFRSAVDAARSRGARLVWTIHNVLPHDARHLELELELNRYLAATADAVHVMNSATASAVSPYYSLDTSRVVHIPHPSYQGVYPGSVTHSEARASLGLRDDDRTVLAFGQMRPYKGLDVLVDAVRRLAPADRPVLLLAGRTTDEDRASIDALLGDDVRAVREHDHVDDIDVQRWFRAADVAVFPYRRVLNSGSLHLAASFGVPSVLPDEPHLRAEFGTRGGSSGSTLAMRRSRWRRCSPSPHRVRPRLRSSAGGWRRSRGRGSTRSCWTTSSPDFCGLKEVAQSPKLSCQLHQDSADAPASG
ncbi:glycosyltransferase [Curtobacterium flaccumfaciens]|nr:glycosyltransferase [Curtobacterium flaccumfaciens]